MKFADMPYKRIIYEETEAEFNELMEAFKNAKSGEEQFEVHKKMYVLNDKIDTMMTIAYIRHDMNTEDEFYDKEQAYYDEIQPKLSNLQIEYDKMLYQSPYRNYLEKKIGTVAFKNIEISLKAFDEKLIPLMQEENALVTKYDKLIASAKIEWEGEILNLSLMRKYLNDKNRDIRRKASKKISEFFLKNADELDQIYDALVKNRTKQAKKMGYNNFVQLGYYRMKRNCYDKRMVENYRSQIKTYFVPFVEKLHEMRRKRLGLEKLSFIDENVYYKEGNPMPSGTPEEILKSGKEMYEELSPETKEFFDFMYENELFDVLGRKAKRAGGYMTYLPEYHSPFVFANFNGTSGDVDVITHECGHAFQRFLSSQNSIREHSDITMETAEIHSMSMEFFTEPWMNLFFGERAEDYKEMHLEDAAAFIPYGCMVDEFQHIVYENPEMKPIERHQEWKKLEKVYKPHLDYEGDTFFEKGGYWQRQLHIYNSPFYYIDYCLAQTCALQFKAMMDEDYKKAWKNYITLCKLSASDFFTNMIKQVGLRSPFEDGCIEAIVEKLEQELI